MLQVSKLDSYCRLQLHPVGSFRQCFPVAGFLSLSLFLPGGFRSLSEESGPVLTHWLLLGVHLQLLGLLLECLLQDLKFFIYFQEIKAVVLHIQRSGWL